jgi:hypothetical protein
MRQHHNDEEREASRILDLVKAGGDAPESVITWALMVLGDAIGLREFYDHL